MLDITKVESKNEVSIVGTLNELEIIEGITRDGRGWIRGIAHVRVDQEINGEMTENIVPVKMFSMRKKKDGTDNKIYDVIASYKNKLTSLAAATDESLASKVSIVAKIDENLFTSQDGKVIEKSWQLSSNFINTKKEDESEAAKFILSGVVGKIRTEEDRSGEETGRAIVDFIVVGYNGRANVISLIAADSKKDYIEANWIEGDTVQVTGRINMTKKIVPWIEEQGFGEPIERHRTESHKELIITGGSPCGLDEANSYDADSIKRILAERSARKEALKTPHKAPVSKAKPDLGF